VIADLSVEVNLLIILENAVACVEIGLSSSLSGDGSITTSNNSKVIVEGCLLGFEVCQLLIED